MQHLRDRFQITNLGEISHYLEMKIDIDTKSKRITLRQFTYLKKIITKYKLTNCRPIKIFISPRVLNSLNSFDKQTNKNTIQ